MIGGKAMTVLNRRTFVQLSGATAFAGALGLPHVARAAGGKVVIIGGGPGGATTARYLKLANPDIDVTLIEPNELYHTCFMSNEVLGGERTIEQIQVGYDGLKKIGVNVVHDFATGIDGGAKTVATKGGQSFAFDRCVVAPGIDFNYTHEGITEADAGNVPHAWKAGEQTVILRKQLEAMEDGGLVAIVAPADPFRCPPGPYERASLIAGYLQEHKPKSKVIIIDPKEKFAKQGLFTGAWKKLYGFETDNSLIEWLPFAKVGGISKVDAGTKEIVTDFETFKPAVLNYIPQQTAGKIAMDAGLADEKGWCPVDKQTFESKKVAGVHVIGDAAIATAMPKSGYSANSQGKVTAAAIAAILAGKEPATPSYVNTCYSIAGKDYGFSVAAVYRYNAEKDVIGGVEGAGGLTPGDASPEQFKREVGYAHSWYNNIRKDSWG